MADAVPWSQLNVPASHPFLGCSLMLQLPTTLRLFTVWLPVLPLVVIEVTPKLLLKLNVSLPPTVFFTILIEPCCWVLVIVQVVVCPANRCMADAVPWSQLNVPESQPVLACSLML